MKWYSLIFFHVFKVYYRDGDFRNDVPWATASALVSVSVLFYFVSIGLVISHVTGIHFMKTMNRHLFVTLGFLFTVLNCAWFKVGDRFLVIFRNFRHSEKDTWKIAILSWLIVIGGLLSVPVTVFFLNFESLSDWLSMWKR